MAAVAGEPDLLKNFIQYVKRSCPGVLGGDAKVLETTLATKEAEEICRIFVNDSKIMALIIQRRLKRRLKSDEDPLLVKDNEEFVLELRMKPLPESNGGCALAYLKAANTLDLTLPMHNQLHICQIDEKNPFHAILSYVKNFFLPLTRSLMASALEDEKQKDSNIGAIRMVNSKLGELEVELMKSQEQVQIPHITLEISKPVADFIRSQKEAGKAPKASQIPHASDTNLLNDVQKGLLEWKKLILSVTTLNWDVDKGTTLQEINFWESMEKAIEHIYAQKDSEGVQITFDLLNENKRFLATTDFNPNVGLAKTKAQDKVYKYSGLLKNFPIKPLISADSVGGIMKALDGIFSHLKQIRLVHYPLARAIQLVHAVSRDVATTLQSVLNARRPMTLNFEEFDKTTQACKELFTAWDTHWEQFAEELRVCKKERPDEDISNIHLPYPEMAAMRLRIADLRRIRKEHEELRSVVEKTLTTDPAVQNSALKAIKEAYQHLRDVEVLDTTPEGTLALELALKAYKAKIDRVEEGLEDRIRTMLNAAKDDANEMFRVCAKFNALFVRPRIQSAIREYQELLIATVKKDIQLLQTKFMSTYSKSQDSNMSLVRDLPPVSGSIYWGRQIERQLDTYISRIGDVLGDQWDHHTDGRTLHRECDQFRQRLQPEKVFGQWLTENKDIAHFQVEGRIFKLDVAGTQNRLVVNFEPRMVTLFKEVRNLNRLGLKVPYEIKIAADEAKEKYSFAVRLDEAVRTYMRTSNTLDKLPDLAPLAASYRLAVQNGIKEGLFCQWDTEKLKEYVDNLGTRAVEYEDQVDELFRYAGKTTVSLQKLETCPPNEKSFKDIMTEVQTVIDHLDKRGFSNLHHWVASLDTRAEKILVARLKHMLSLWVQAQDIELSVEDEQLDLDSAIAELKARHEHQAKDDLNYEEAERKAADEKAKALEFIVKQGPRHRITIRNQMLHVDPPMEGAMLALSKDLQKWLAVICELPRLKCFWTTQQEQSKDQETFRSALGKLETSDLQQCFDCINKKIAQAQAYVETWLQYQALWDMDLDQVCSSLGADVTKWERLMLDMKRSRATFDNSSTTKRFGPIIVEYGSVQAKVNNKYDQWVKNIMSRFGQMLGGAIGTLYSNLGTGRQQLESFHFDFTTTQEIVDSVTLLHSLREKAKVYKVQLDEDDKGENLLRNNRFMFPGDWLYMERVHSEWNAFDQILGRKLQRMNADSEKIQAKIAEEHKKLEKRIEDLVNDWKKNRPVGQDLHVDDVLNTLGLYDKRVGDLQSELESMTNARVAMNMPVKEEHRLKPVREEIDQLKNVWDVLGGGWKSLQTIGEFEFETCKVKEIRKNLSKLQADLQRLPTEVRQYAGFDNLKQAVKERLDYNAALTDLSSGVLRPKHQRQILQILKIDAPWSTVTVNQLWNADLKRHLKQIRFILEQAQGESALEEFLKQIQRDWESTKLELVDYRQKNWLIKNWDPIFEQLGDALSDLGSMKSSPFFAAFEAEASKWESKLNHAQSIFDIFIDVQRRWVYLEGIFAGSQDVQLQLAYQYKQFQNFDRDYVRLMREMKREDMADYWIKPERGLLPMVEGWAETLNAILKALAEYLEKQRQIFPRFYFVGDEDLLEIIGNSKNVLKVQRHFAKMFAGINSVNLAENEDNTIIAMVSKEGEVVPLNAPIKVPEHKTIQSWLLALETQMRSTLATLLEKCLRDMATWQTGGEDVVPGPFFKWVDAYPSQIINIAVMVDYSEKVEDELVKKQGPTTMLKRCLKTLDVLAQQILSPDLPNDRRKKYEQLITEMVHQRDVSRHLLEAKVVSEEDFEWLGQTRFYFRRKPKHASSMITGECTVESALIIQVSRACFYYGFEYLGVSEKLVQTPLTDRCYLTLCEAMHMRLGGNPYGPAGTGKTETVKALGAALGRMVLVFNCDEHFDFQAMGRIMIGLCQCGAWGCFDEFNRLEERILSAVSQQILTIQTGLNAKSKEIVLLQKQIKLSENMGMFVTMNPGYAGRSNLPDNLKQLFRGIAMIKPDASLIGQVLLYSQGFRTAEQIASKVVMLFQLCDDQLSTQNHYDFGLRAVKGVLRSAGNLKRKIIQLRKEQENKPKEQKVETKDEEGKPIEEEPYVDIIGGLDFSSPEGEQAILVKSICGTVVPKLISADIALFGTLMKAVFPTAEVSAPTDAKITAELAKICAHRDLVFGQNWVDKIMQFYEILDICHGVIVVGPAGTGKTTAWTALREALEKVQGTKIKFYVIDPKAMTKEDLFGVLDNTTLEWTDGVFTHILRKIIDNVRGEQTQKHWIVFDGDVDPEWAENLNSVLDDNKLFTLRNGERLALTPNIRLIFEVANLDYATLATVSRCGMVWFSNLVVSLEMHLENCWLRLEHEPIQSLQPSVYARWKTTQAQAAQSIKKFFVAGEGGDETDTIRLALHSIEQNIEHVMEFSASRALMTMFCLVKAGIAKIIDYNDNHMDYPLPIEKVTKFMEKTLLYAILWGFSGDLSLEGRYAFGKDFVKFTKVEMPRGHEPLIEYEVRVDTAEWHLWKERVPQVELEAAKVIKPDVVIETIDTVRHTDVLSAWLGDRRPLILCGPPGAGKSMTLTAVLNAMPDFELVTLNFSSSTGIDLILRTLKHHCTSEKTPTGSVLRPVVRNKWLVIFCDEINLPKTDQYGTQRVITFLRQITEHGGFWRGSDLSFVTLERIQIIGACNPPTDAGRVKLSNRFLRHSPLMFVDFPSIPSLRIIYGTFVRAMLKLQPSLRAHAEPVTEAMIEVYADSQKRFTPDVQPHYIYSPRELSRWVRAMYEAMNPSGEGRQSLTLSYNDLVRLWLHEALRLFQDRLVESSECEWTDRKVNDVAHKHFRNADLNTALARPVLYSDWLSKNYCSVNQEELRTHVKLRLQVFREEELDVKLVIFDEVLAHILRIDRVLRQPLGHLLLVGTSGGGKTILSKFVSWMCGYSVFQIKVHKFYKAEDFDRDLRDVLTRSGCQAEKICFIFDESNVLDSAFLERMNALLASGEVPGLFENADWDNLMEQCKMAASRDGVITNKEEELYKYFCTQVQRNLHVVFTMNPANEDFDNRTATSPALFNRCVIDWFGEWSHTALYQVGHEFTLKLQLSDAPPGATNEVKKGYESDDDGEKPKMLQGSGTERDNVVSTLVYVHESVGKAMQMLARNTNRRTYITPRHFLDFISHYQKLSGDKRSELEENQFHLTSGLRKLNETQTQVASLKVALIKKEQELKAKEKAANEKLEQMMVDKAEAEKKRDASAVIAKEIAVQEVQINERKASVELEFAGAKPALDAAQAAVADIKKDDLDQVSRFPNPPGPVKLALEPVILMLGKPIDDWPYIRRVLRNNDQPFIKSILQYDVEQLNEKLRVQIEQKYLTDPNFTFEIVYNASKACGPLVKWVSSVIKYAKVKNSVQPLLDELKGIEEKASALKTKNDQLNQIREELTKRIEQYKIEYSELVREAQAIKADMEVVKVKCERSEKLLANLSTEQNRWTLDCAEFKKQISTIVGDALVSAAFIAYIGYFNQSYRALLVEKWTERLKKVGVPTRDNLSIINYLSHPSQRLDWISHDLPEDDLCVENAIMMQRFNRYPLIIDPSGQAVLFLMKQYKDRKIIRTSFLDESFLKHLEASLRFGNALLVEDVESLDPVLNSVLNKEIFRQGGRVMITLGDKEIDFSPSFIIFLATRDPACHFTPDLCSRVTFINFTVTPSSLTTQCLSKSLKAERPDVDKKRSAMLALQGEFRVKLRNLEDSLLTSLSGVKGNILDDETVMNTLETLKNQSLDVMSKMAEADQTMEEIESVSSFYRRYAQAFANVYFSLESLSRVHFLYQYSLLFFLNVVDQILFRQSAEVKAETDPKKRFQMIVLQMFEIVFERAARGLLYQDQIGFALRLAQIACEVELGTGATPLAYPEVEFLLKGRSADRAASATTLAKDLKLDFKHTNLLGFLLHLPAFANLGSHIAANKAQWLEFMTQPNDPARKKEEKDDHKFQDITPTGWEKAPNLPQKIFHQLLACKVLRPDRVTEVTQCFVRAVFGPKLLASTNQFDFAKVVKEESDCNTPLLLVSRPGYDASAKVDTLVQQLGMNEKYESFAMGSPEGYKDAERAIATASKAGTWVLCKNVHLAIVWLGNLEKKLHRMTNHPEFRIFMTSELNEKVPANLFRMSNVIIFEPPVGMKASMLRMLKAMPPERVNKAPAERGRLYFLLAWVHSVILERLRYVPVGWSKGFEFSETDARCAMDALDEWVDKRAQGKANISPTAIPWDALRALLQQIIYGGRIDNEFDQARLEAFVGSLFVKEAYDDKFPLCTTWSSKDGAYKPLMTMPESKDHKGFKTWVDAMPDVNNPELLGLPSNAESMLLSVAGEHMTHEVLALQDNTGGEEEQGSVEEKGVDVAAAKKSRGTRLSFTSGPAAASVEKPTWMVSLEVSVSRWLSQLPPATKLPELPKGQAAEKLVLNPLYRCMQREYNNFRKILATIHVDLLLVKNVMSGKEPANNKVRALFQFLRRDAVPDTWGKYSGALGKMPTTLWMSDFVKRVELMHLMGGHSAEKYSELDIWLGGLMHPEAFVAATRQAVAQAHNWSLEDLELRISVLEDPKAGGPRTDCYTFTGFELHGAVWAKNALSITHTDLSFKMPAVRFTWVLKSQAKPEGEIVRTPVYTDHTREKFLFACNLARPPSVAASSWSQRGVALTCWTS